MILEGWGDEFPFNSRNIFVAEWEELWFRYILARYDAYNAVWFWQLHNEYEYYPNGDWHYARNGVANRWAIRMAHLVRRLAPHGHVVAIHNGPEMPSFGQRFASDPTVIDTVMFQTWGTTSEAHGWLAAGIEDRIRESLHDWPGSAVLSEWGYEFNPELPPMMLGHRWCDADHTRRGAWRGAMSGVGIIHGFENSWGPFMELDEDQEGLEHLLHVRHFFSEVVPFDRLKPAPDLVSSTDQRRGHAPLGLASADGDVAVVYLPVGGEITVEHGNRFATGTWFNPRTGELGEASAVTGQVAFSPPEPKIGERPVDWVLILLA
jgi:hypothetical protein